MSRTRGQEAPQSPPQPPVRLGTVDVGRGGRGTKLLLGDLTGDGRRELVTVQPQGGVDSRYIPQQAQCITAFDLDGRLLWQAGTAAARPGGHGADIPVQIADIDGDGRNEVVCVMEKQLRVLAGSSGEVLHRIALPHPRAHDCIIVANFTCGPERSLVLKDRYSQLWALGPDFRVLWTHRGNLGHYPWPYDFDGDGRDELMAGYDFLNHDGTLRWSCQGLPEHADCLWVADIDGDGSEEILIGQGGVYAYRPDGTERWRNQRPREVQHLAPGRYRDDVSGLQIAGLDRIVRGGRGRGGRDGIFLLDSDGGPLANEDRQTRGWLTIIEPLRGWDAGDLDYILAWRRGGGVPPGLYDGRLEPVVTFPVDGQVVHGPLTGRRRTQVLIMDPSGTVHIFASEEMDLTAPKDGGPLPQTRRLMASTLYPGGQLPLA